MPRDVCGGRATVIAVQSSDTTVEASVTSSTGTSGRSTSSAGFRCSSRLGSRKESQGEADAESTCARFFHGRRGDGGKVTVLSRSG
jgi:hypothetical protein